VYLCDTAVTQSSRTYTHPTGNISIIQVGPPFSHPRRFMTALGTYPENPTRLTLSRVQVIQYLSFLLASTIFIHSGSKPEQWGSPKESPPFGHLPGGFFVTWPHRSCFFHSPLIFGGGSQACTIFFVNFRLPSLGIPKPMLPFETPVSTFTFYQWTTPLYAVSHADSVAAPFPGS